MNGSRKCGHLYNGILLGHKKEWNWTICSDVDEPRVCHTKWVKSEREKQILMHINVCIYINIYGKSRKIVQINQICKAGIEL